MSYDGRFYPPAQTNEDEYYSLSYLLKLAPSVVLMAASRPCMLGVLSTDPGFAVDAAPSSRLVGPAAVGTPTDGSSALPIAIVQRIAGMQPGNTYLLESWAEDSAGNQSIHMSGSIYCAPPPSQ